MRFAIPASVIWRASKLRDLRDVNPDNFFKPPSFTNVNDRFKFSRLVKPKEQARNINQQMPLKPYIFLEIHGATITTTKRT